MDNLFNFITGPFASVVGILTAVPVFALGWDRFFGRGRRHKKWMQNAVNTSGQLSAVLIVDLLAARGIGAAVKHFMVSEEALKDIPDERVISINRDKDLLPQDMQGLAIDIQDAAGEVLKHGVDVLYVFLAGPACAAAMVGAELSNIGKVILYQHDRASGAYVNFGPLRHPRF